MAKIQTKIIMKKITLTLVLALITSTFINAQVKIKPVAKIGLNFASLTTPISINESSGLTSFHIGGAVNFKFTDLYTLSPEILYSKQGAEKTTNNKINVDYLSIVVNNKFYIGKGNFNLQVAPVLDILINDNNNSNLFNYQGADFGVMGGVGYDFPFGLTIDARFKQGLVDIFGLNVDNGNGSQTTSFEDLTLNQVFQLSFGYQFDF